MTVLKNSLRGLNILNSHFVRVYLPFFIIGIFIITSSINTYAQTTIVEWNFNDTTPPEPDDIADDGISGNINVKQIVTEARAIASYPSGITGQSVSVLDWTSGSGLKYWMIEFETSGYESLTLSSNQRSDNTGPRDFKIQYRVGAGSWADVPSGTVPVLTNTWGSGGNISSLSLPAALDNQSSVSLRWIMTSNSPVSGLGINSGGSSEIDDIQILGTVSISSPTVNIASNSPSAGTFIRNSDNNVLYRLDLSVTDDDANLTELTLTTAGLYTTSDFELSGFKLWYSSDASFDSGTDNLLQSENPVTTGSDLIFTGLSQQISVGTTGYLFLTVDVSNNMNKGNTISITSTDLSNIVFTPSATKTGSAPGSNTQTLDCLDTDSEVYDISALGQSQPTGGTISSLVNDDLSAVHVFSFIIWDIGNCDGLSTNVTNVRIKPGANNNASWIQSIGGVTLAGQSIGDIGIGTLDITDTYIDIPILTDELVISNSPYDEGVMNVLLTGSAKNP